MKAAIRWACGVLLTVQMLSACDRLPGGPSTAIVDLEVIAKATGQDSEFERKLATRRTELNSQLEQVAVDLEKQLADERARIGEQFTAEQEQKYQQLEAQAQQQYGQSQALAQQRQQQYRSELATEFREKVRPIAAKVAASRGATTVLVTGPGMLWFDDEVDITDEVLASMRAQPSSDVGTTTPDAGDAATDGN